MAKYIELFSITRHFTLFDKRKATKRFSELKINKSMTVDEAASAESTVQWKNIPTPFLKKLVKNSISLANLPKFN